MKASNTYLSTVVGAAMTLVATGFAPASFAAHEGEEQCAGVIKTGKNDCATSTNQCHSHVTVDAAPEAWIYVPPLPYLNPTHRSCASGEPSCSNSCAAH